MNKFQVLTRLKDISNWTDSEAAHAEADRLLLEYLKSNDDKDIAEAYEFCRSEVGFWYA